MSFSGELENTGFNSNLIEKILNKKVRSIFDDWEVSQDKPNIYEPFIFQQEDFIPYGSAEEYIKYVNECQPQAFYPYDDKLMMPGRYTSAEMINDEVWVTFSPEKLGKYWVLLPK
jgi:hypothetical protein